MYFVTAFVAQLIDRYVPYPTFLTQAIGHPVMWQGWIINRFEARLNDPELPNRERRRNGVIMLATLLIASLIVALILQKLISYLPYSWIFEAALASAMLAHRELKIAVHDVSKALASSIQNARMAVAKIVGRDTQNLDEHEISRAAIESLAENSSDGVIAPLFWLALFGLPGIVAYKAINTADSMVGHLNERYAEFGWASAKLDDAVNWLPARLTAIFYTIAAILAPNGSAKRAWSTAMRDAPKHGSPNAGWPEAAMAGALNFGLGGPRSYNGKTLNLPAMGSGRRDLVAKDIAQSLMLTEAMVTVASIVVGMIALGQF